MCEFFGSHGPIQVHPNAEADKRLKTITPAYVAGIKLSEGAFPVLPLMARELRSPSAMNSEENDILTFLKGYGKLYVSVVEISRRLGVRGRKYQMDRAWARPILMRMEMDGTLESNEYGEFRIRNRPEDTCFLEAIKQADPKVPLGETTIIRLRESDDPAQTAA